MTDLFKFPTPEDKFYRRGCGFTGCYGGRVVMERTTPHWPSDPYAPISADRERWWEPCPYCSGTPKHQRRSGD